ncbi:MAG: ParB/RepB/Spo0J family partition protein [Candidatus Neomarinimicrobiota bacterium]|nr:MAG: ParB/RepB/Spo0J family partition protein [Candidatus Neomarinimicrobiota bacterium]
MTANRLGRGLEALIRPQEDIVTGHKPGVLSIPLDQIHANPFQPRQEFDEAGLEELANSIREKGVLTPVTVQEQDSGGFRLVAGERRCRAARLAGLTEVPAYVVEVSSEAEMMEMALIENIQRQDLNPLEEAEAYAVLHSKFDLSQEAIARAVGKNRTTITNALRLLNLPPRIRTSLQKGEISAGHGRAILQMKTPRAMEKLWRTICQKALSVRQAEALARDWSAPRKAGKSSRPAVSPEVQAIENDLISRLGTKVRLKSGRKGGVIEISYFSDEELDRLLDLLRSLGN